MNYRKCVQISLQPDWPINRGMAFLAALPWHTLKSWYTDGGQNIGFWCWLADVLIVRGAGCGIGDFINSVV